MQILFNGKSCTVAEGSSIAALLERFQLEPRYVAVEVNYDVVPRQRHAEYVLKDGDRLEVVTLVGGG